MKKLKPNRLLIALLVAGLIPVLAQGETTAETVATVSAVNGPVQVNQGAQFQPLLIDQPLGEGDRILAGSGGSATLTYPDGSTLDIAPETLVTVPATSAGGATLVQSTSPSGTGAVGAMGPNGASAAGRSGGIGFGEDAGFALAAALVMTGGAIVSALEDEKDVSSP